MTSSPVTTGTHYSNNPQAFVELQTTMNLKLSLTEIEAFKSSSQHKYVPLALAGSGSAGQVFYALPKTACQNRNDKSNIPALRKQICAVKILSEVDAYFLDRHGAFTCEIKALQHIKADPESKTFHLPQLLSYLLAADAGPSRQTYFSMTAIPGFPMSHVEACSQDCGVPKALVAHAYIQLHAAIHFLHTRSVPIVKGDMQSFNVMVRPTRLAADPFPDFILVDFGCSTVNASATECNVEWSWFCTMMNQFSTCGMMGCPESEKARGDEEWEFFVAKLGRVWLDCQNMDGAGWEKFLGRLKGIAERARTEVSEDSLVRIKRMIVAMDGMYNKMPSDKVILEALCHEL